MTERPGKPAHLAPRAVRATVTARQSCVLQESTVRAIVQLAHRAAAIPSSAPTAGSHVLPALRGPLRQAITQIPARVALFAPVAMRVMAPVTSKAVQLGPFRPGDQTAAPRAERTTLTRKTGRASAQSADLENRRLVLIQARAIPVVLARQAIGALGRALQYRAPQASLQELVPSVVQTAVTTKSIRH